jgi:hypothetical protein
MRTLFFAALFILLRAEWVWAQESPSRPLDRFARQADKNGQAKNENSDRGPLGANDAAKIAIRSDHIFRGAINRRGDIVGVHHLPSAPKQLRVDGRLCDLEIRKTSPGGDKDVVTAKVILRDPATGKIVREKFSTLFPSAWDKDDILGAIRDAYSYALRHGGVDRDGKFHGRARGITIDGYLSEDRDAIATAFPVFQGSRNKTHDQGSRR